MPAAVPLGRSAVIRSECGSCDSHVVRAVVEIDSFDNIASAEVFAGALRAAGLAPVVSRIGPLAAVGVPTRAVVKVSRSEAGVARQILEKGRLAAQQGEDVLRRQWLQVPGEAIEAGVDEIRRRLRVMWWSSLAVPGGLILAVLTLAVGPNWLSVACVAGGLTVAALASRAVGRCRCPRCGEYFFRQYVRDIGQYLDARCVRCELQLRTPRPN
jgi:hypothetical protein